MQLDPRLTRRLRLWVYHRLYRELAWTYDVISWVVSFGQWAAWRSLALDYVVGEQVLEIGYGTGELLIEARRQDICIVGMEKSASMEHIAVGKMRKTGVEAPVIRGDIQHMPFADNAFDCVVSTFPAEFILNQATWEEMGRIVRAPNKENGRQGGRVVIVGIVVELENPLERALSQTVPGGKAPSEWYRCLSLAEAVGFKISVEERDMRWSRVPILIAEWAGT